MDEFVVYILYSSLYNKTYCGQTTNLITRFKDHNELGNKGWARKYQPWVIIHVEPFHWTSEAVKREKVLKSGRDRAWIQVNFLSR